MRHDQGYFEEQHLKKTYDLKLLRRLFPFTMPYRTLIFLSVLLVMLITLLDLAVPYITKITIDQYIVPMFDGFETADPKDSDDNARRLKVKLENPDGIRNYS